MNFLGGTDPLFQKQKNTKSLKNIAIDIKFLEQNTKTSLQKSLKITNLIFFKKRHNNFKKHKHKK